MRRRLARLVAAMVLLVGLVSRGSAHEEGPAGYVFELRDGEDIHLIRADVSTVDSVLAKAGRLPLGAEIPLRQGDGLVRRGQGWAVEPARHPLLFGAKVDLNRTDALALQDLPGVGPSMAGAIMDARPYRSTGEVIRARGVGPTALGQIESLLVVAPGVPEAPVVVVSLNCADLSALVSLPRIGPSYAARIIAARPFAHLADVERVRGIGPTTRAGLEGRVSVESCAR